MSATSLYDLDQRAIASQLDEQYRPHGWVIWWGPWSRLFWAVPCWQDAPVRMVHACTPAALLAAMNDVSPGRRAGSGHTRRAAVPMPGVDGTWTPRNPA